MLKDDYIMKIVEQAGGVLRHVLRLMEQGKQAEALEEIDATMQLNTGLTLAEANQFSAEQIIARLRSNEMAGFGEILMVAELLTVDALIRDQTGDEDGAYERRLKALELHFSLAIGHDLTHIPTDGNIEALLHAVNEYELPVAIVQRKFTYYEKAGNYAAAENTLYELLEEYNTEEDMVELGMAFYERLLQKSDYDLLSGNLPRAEVNAGIEELWQQHAR